MSVHKKMTNKILHLKFTGHQKNPKMLSGKLVDPELPSPKSLIELAGEIANKLPKPDCWTWTVDDVVNWVEKALQLPQYTVPAFERQECFKKNHITGRKLLNIDGSALPQMNITDFNHIKKITTAIRNLFRIEMVLFKRSISLPKYKPETYYLRYTSKTGQDYNFLTRLEVFRILKIINEGNESQHWNTIFLPLPECPKVIIGISRKKFKAAGVLPKKVISIECYTKQSWQKLNCIE